MSLLLDECTCHLVAVVAKSCQSDLVRAAVGLLSGKKKSEIVAGKILITSSLANKSTSNLPHTGVGQTDGIVGKF